MITKEQLNSFTRELCAMGAEIQKNKLEWPVLKLDRDTFRDLEAAIIEERGKLHTGGRFFDYPPRLLGFEIVVTP